MPRRARYLVPRGLPRRDEVLAVCVVAVVLAHALFAQLSILLAAVFYLITRATRWRLSWLAVPAAAGLAWTAAIGPRAAAAGLTAGPARIADYLGARGHQAGHLLHFTAAFAGIGTWLPRQLPLALVAGAAEAALAGGLTWLHTDEWELRPARPGLIVAARRAAAVRAIRAGGVVTRDGGSLGVDAGSGARVTLSWAEAAGGTAVRGSSGPDVLTAGFQLVHAAVRRRKPVLAVDHTADPALAGQLAGVCAAAGAPLLVFGEDGAGVRAAGYEPFRHGAPARRAALIAAMLSWDGPGRQYRRSCVSYLEDVFELLDAAPGDPRVPVLDDVIHLLNPVAMRARMEYVPAAYPRREVLADRTRVSVSLVTDEPATIAEVGRQLRALRASPFGRWLRPSPDGPAADIDLSRAVAARAVVLLRLGGPRPAECCAMLTRLVCQDLLAAGAALGGIGVGGDGIIWLTECAALPRAPVTEMIARGRDTGLPVLAATTSAQVGADIADLANVVVSLPMAGTAAARGPAAVTRDPAPEGDDGTAGSGVPSALRDGEFRLTVKDPPRLVARGSLVRARMRAAAAGPATTPRRAWEGTLRARPARRPSVMLIVFAMSRNVNQLLVGYQYAAPHPEPGPPPRRPAPPEQERLNPGWAAAQRREESLLSRPLKAAFGAAVALGLTALALGAAGLLNALAAGLGVICCALVAAVSGYAIWQGERALRSRLADEQARVGQLRAAQESRLFAWQAEHAARMRDWQRLRGAYEHQKRWYPVCAPDGVHRVDIAGGTLSGWAAMLATAGANRLAAGGEVTVLDLTEGSVALDLIGFARASGIDPLVWVLPDDLPRLDLGTGLGREALADLLAQVASVTDEQASARDLSLDTSILEWVIDVLAENPRRPATVAAVAAGLRALAQAGDPRDDVAAGLITDGQADRLTAMFGRAATERVVLERAWILEAQLRRLAPAGTALAPLPRSALRVVALGRRAGAAGSRVLATYLTVALTHLLRDAEPGPPWQHTLFVLGADRLRGDVLDRLTDACERSATGLVLAYRGIPVQVRQRLGRGNAAVAFMRLGNAEEAKAASEQIGTEHRFVLSQLTETIGTSVTDTTGSSYTSTMGSADSTATSWSQSEGLSRSTGRGHSDGSLLLPSRASFSRSVQTGDSRSTSRSESVSASLSTSTAWGMTTSRATGDSETLARALQRSREFLVEQHELQQLPASAMIITYAGPAGRQVVMADANPGIGGLGATTALTLEESRGAPDPVSRRPGQRVRPPPNLGPPAPRLDWRRAAPGPDTIRPR